MLSAGFLISDSAIMLREAIDCESNGIELLAGIYWIAVGIKTPICSTILLVDEMVAYIISGTQGCIGIFRFAIMAICSGEAPKNSRIQYSAFLCFGIKTVVAIATAIKPPRGSVILSIQ